MFRRLLTLQLIFAVAAAPFVCCCTAGRLLASPLPPAGSASHAQAAGLSGAASPCCSHKHQPEKPSPGQQPSPTSPGEKCPCKDGSGGVDTIQADATQADVSTLLRAESLDFALPFAVVDSTPCPTRLGQGSVPSRGPNASLPSTADLLFAHHNLRC